MRLRSAWGAKGRNPFVLFIASLCIAIGGPDPYAASVVAWGSGPGTNVPPDLGNVISIAAGAEHALALMPDRTVVAWGNNAYGQTNVPPTLGPVRELAAGFHHSAALLENGRVVVWGANHREQRAVPEGLTNVVRIVAGASHMLAMLEDGRVTNWGQYWLEGTTYGPKPVPADLTNIIAIAAGEDHDLFLTKDGTIRAWGANQAGQADVPAGLTNVVAIGAGTYHSIALCSDGSLVAWGGDPWGQVRDTPCGEKVVSICVGMEHNFAVRTDGSLAGWGRNDSGQLSVPSELGIIRDLKAGARFSLALAEGIPPSGDLRLTGPRLDDEGFHFSFQTTAGSAYAIEFKEPTEVWKTLTTVMGDGQILIVSDPAPLPANRIYRVRQAE